MEQFVIKNPRWEVVGKSLSIFLIQNIVEVPAFRLPPSTAEFNGMVNESKPYIKSLLEIYGIDDSQILDDLAIIYLVIKTEFKDQTVEEIQDGKDIDIYYSKIGNIISKVEDYNRVNYKTNRGFKIRIESDFPKGSEWKFKSVDVPISITDDLWNVVKQHYMRKKERVIPKLKSIVSGKRQITKYLIIGFYNYLLNELKLKQYQCEEFIEYFSTHLTTPLGPLKSDQVQQTIRRSNSDK